MIQVYVSVLVEGDRAGHAIVQLPFVPERGDTFFMNPGWAGMEVHARSCTANDKQAEISVSANTWTIEELKEVGFTISESYLHFQKMRSAR